MIEDKLPAKIRKSTHHEVATTEGIVGREAAIKHAISACPWFGGFYLKSIVCRSAISGSLFKH